MPQGGGTDCAGNRTELTPCNTHSCKLPGDFLWGQWSACDAQCGKGLRFRKTMCGALRKKVVGIEHGQKVLVTASPPPSTGIHYNYAKIRKKAQFTFGIKSKAATSTTAATPTGKRRRRSIPDEDLMLYELAYLEECSDNQKAIEQDECNTWDKENCPDQCIGVRCPAYAKCIDTSTNKAPSAECVCQMGTIMKDDKSACIRSVL